MSTKKPFKVGDPVVYEHLGMAKTGNIIELLDGEKARIKDERGYVYRYGIENISHAGDPIVTNPQVPAPKQTTTQSNTKPMTEKATTPEAAAEKVVVKSTKTPKEPKAVETSTADPATIEKIVSLTGCKKHQRIFLLLSIGCTKEEVAAHGKCNFGEISNARKMYAESEEKAAAAKALLV